MTAPKYLHLYKEALTCLRLLPLSHQGHFRKKMAYNFREIFDVIRGAPNDTGEMFMNRIRKDVDFLRQIFTLQPELIKDLIPVFENDTVNKNHPI
jgi:hypothetical protein